MAKDEIVDAEGEGAPAADSFYTGLVVFTTIALVAGFILIELGYGHNYGGGLFK
jgi:hypothetical protein